MRFRLQSQHPAPECTSTDLAVQWLHKEGSWEPQHLNLTMPGLRIYLISLLLCQHHYPVANARAHQVPLAGVEAEFVVTTSQDWILQSVIGTFQLQLDAEGDRGQPAEVSEADMASLQHHMKASPMSRNLQIRSGKNHLATDQMRLKASATDKRPDATTRL